MAKLWNGKDWSRTSTTMQKGVCFIGENSKTTNINYWEVIQANMPNVREYIAEYNQKERDLNSHYKFFLDIDSDDITSTMLETVIKNMIRDGYAFESLPGDEEIMSPKDCYNNLFIKTQIDNTVLVEFEYEGEANKAQAYYGNDYTARILEEYYLDSYNRDNLKCLSYEFGNILDTAGKNLKFEYNKPVDIYSVYKECLNEFANQAVNQFTEYRNQLPWLKFMSDDQFKELLESGESDAEITDELIIRAKFKYSDILDMFYISAKTQNVNWGNLVFAYIDKETGELKGNCGVCLNIGEFENLAFKENSNGALDFITASMKDVLPLRATEEYYTALYIPENCPETVITNSEYNKARNNNKMYEFLFKYRDKIPYIKELDDENFNNLINTDSAFIKDDRLEIDIKGNSPDLDGEEMENFESSLYKDGLRMPYMLRNIIYSKDESLIFNLECYGESRGCLHFTMTETGELKDMYCDNKEYETQLKQIISDWENELSPLAQKEKELSKLEKEEQAISETEALIDKGNQKQGEQVGE